MADVWGEVEPALFIDAAEHDLHRALRATEPLVDAAVAAGEYVTALKVLAGLHTEVDAFFVQVLVNVEDLRIQKNRLALLSQASRLMNQVADISKLVRPVVSGH